jgi:hypothetical protein
MSYPITLGLEEEFFLLYQGKPQLSSLTNLSKLLWSDPRFYFTRSASNFSRKGGAKQGIMSALEVSTRVCSTVPELMAEVVARRLDVMQVCPTGLIAHVGMIPRDDPYNTAGMHIHVGVPETERQRVYANLVRFLPILALASSSSPWKGTEPYGQSYRMHASYALGNLQSNPLERFQDLILTRRLGTLELRVLDPVWDLKRLGAIVAAVYALAATPKALEGNVETYNRLRSSYAQHGLNAQGLNAQGLSQELSELALELYDFCGFELHWTQNTVSDQLLELERSHGLPAVFRHLDGGIRNGTFSPSSTPDDLPSSVQEALGGIWGFSTYYLPRLAYISWKVWKENKG